eukprot:symbB.v1.2.030878.t1/scaffold3459.1/size56318/1
MADTRALAVSRCISDIEVADFVALDLEFSGLFLDTKRERAAMSYEDYFAKCAESVPNFLVLQLGLCCVQFQSETSTWELRTHQFDLCPQEQRIFNVDMSSLRFLRANGFDFNLFLEKAHPYRRMKLEGASTTGRHSPCASHILAALRKSQAPLVVHNGLLDLLHVYDKFVADLPKESQDFGKAWLEHFPLTFDTRFVAQEGRLDVFKHLGGLSLEALYSPLRGQSALKIEKCGEVPGGSAHSAGYDARVTAEVFLLELDIWIRFQKRRKQEKQAAAAESGQNAENAGHEPDAQGAQDGQGESRESEQDAEGASKEETASNEIATEVAKSEQDEEGWSTVTRNRKRKRGADGLPEDKGLTIGLTCPSPLAETLLHFDFVCVGLVDEC